MIWYRCLCVDPDQFYDLKNSPQMYDLDHDFWLHEAAEDYHNRQDGWECSWPLEFAIHDGERGLEIARACIDRDTKPVFRVGNVTVRR